MAKSAFEKVFEAFFGQSVSLKLSEEISSAEDVFASDFITQLNLPTPEVSKIDAPAETASKTVSDLMSPGTAVIELGTTKAIATLERKPNVQLLRNYAKNSTWVRAAIDYERRMLGRAKFEIVPIDSTIEPESNDEKVRGFVEDVLRHPNAADESYGTLKEQMIEDYLVIGHGCLELELNRDLTVRGLRILDSGRIGFIKNWDGTDNAVPRFVEFEDKYLSRVKRYLAHQQVMCLVNRPMSDTRLGFSHVEALHKTVVALLSGDDYLLKQIIEPVSDKMISLGEGATQTQVDDFKFQIRQVRDKLAIIGGVKDPKVLNLSASVDEMKILDGCEWFVRQVAAIFDISTAKLKLAVDTSRANTETMFDDDIQAVEGDLTRIEELENSVFINRYIYLGDVNLKFTYPILHRKDEKEQAQIAKIQSGDQGWAAPNEARARTGEKPLDEKEFPFANEILIRTKDGPVPMSIMNLKWEKMREEILNPPKPDEPGATDTGKQ